MDRYNRDVKLPHIFPVCHSCEAQHMRYLLSNMKAFGQQMKKYVTIVNKSVLSEHAA